MILSDSLQTFILSLVIRAGLAIAVLLIGRRLARMGRAWVQKAIALTDVTESVVTLGSTVTFYLIWLFAILTALAITGVPTSSLLSVSALIVLILAIAASQWVNFARTVRGSTLVEKSKEYVQAARVIGVRPLFIMVRHVLPNVTGPVLVIATLSLAIAILTEATLSFLGVGVPPTQPSLGTLIRFGNNFLFSGEWWMTIFPGLALVILALAVNLLGDWLRDALNPKLR